MKPDSYTPNVADPAAIIATLEAQSTRHETPCGDGRMVWRRWGSGPEVVLLHGGGGAWTHWVRNIGALAQRHTVWAADLPGLGDSASLPEYNVEAIAEPVAQGLRELFGDRSFDLVTFSFGGPVGCYAASRPGMRVGKLVLTAARFILEDRHVFPKLARWKDVPDEAGRMAAHGRNLELMMIADPANIDALALQIQSTNTPKARYAGPPLQPGEKLHLYLPQVNVEQSVSAISGTRDHVAQAIMEQQQTGLDVVRPGGRFYPIAGAGHWVQYEAAQAYNALLLKILSGQEG